MNKKITLILLILIILSIIIIGGLAYCYITIEHTDEYMGEYDMEFCIDYSKNFEIFSDVEPSNFIAEVLSYSEYVDYCNNMDLEINYSNEEWNYIVMKGFVAENFKLNDIIYFNNEATIFWSYFSEEGVAVEYALGGTFIIIPTENTINDINIYNITTLSEIIEYVLIILIIFTIVCIVIIIGFLKKKN